MNLKCLFKHDWLVMRVSTKAALDFWPGVKACVLAVLLTLCAIAALVWWAPKGGPGAEAKDVAAFAIGLATIAAFLALTVVTFCSFPIFEAKDRMCGQCQKLDLYLTKTEEYIARRAITQKTLAAQYEKLCELRKKAV